jgi:hypothetical protein
MPVVGRSLSGDMPHEPSSDEEETWLMRKLFGVRRVETDSSWAATHGNGVTKEELFRIDRKRSSPQDDVERVAHGAGCADTDKHDEDSHVSLADTRRLKKLRLAGERDDVRVSGPEFEARLRRQFAKLHREPDWAKLPDSRGELDDDGLAEECRFLHR